MGSNLAALDNSNTNIQIKEQINNKYNIYFHKIKGLKVLNSLMVEDAEAFVFPLLFFHKAVTPQLQVMERYLCFWTGTVGRLH